VVEIPDDDSPPLGWDQWISFPALSPESQEGAIVRRREGHMVAGGRGHGAEASSFCTGHSAPVEELVGDPPAFADAQGEQELSGELRNHGAALDRALNEALRIHGSPAWRVFQVGYRRVLSLFSRFRVRTLQHDAHRSRFVDGRNSSTALVTSTVPSTRCSPSSASFGSSATPSTRLPTP
jgi:hypothetical protein